MLRNRKRTLTVRLLRQVPAPEGQRPARSDGHSLSPRPRVGRERQMLAQCLTENQHSRAHQPLPRGFCRKRIFSEDPKERSAPGQSPQLPDRDALGLQPPEGLLASGLALALTSCGFSALTCHSYPPPPNCEASRTGTLGPVLPLFPQHLQLDKACWKNGLPGVNMTPWSSWQHGSWAHSCAPQKPPSLPPWAVQDDRSMYGAPDLMLEWGRAP